MGYVVMNISYFSLYNLISGPFSAFMIKKLLLHNYSLLIDFLCVSHDLPLWVAAVPSYHYDDRVSDGWRERFSYNGAKLNRIFSGSICRVVYSFNKLCIYENKNISLNILHFVLELPKQIVMTICRRGKSKTCTNKHLTGSNHSRLLESKPRVCVCETIR